MDEGKGFKSTWASFIIGNFTLKVGLRVWFDSFLEIVQQGHRETANIIEGQTIKYFTGTHIRVNAWVS